MNPLAGARSHPKFLTDQLSILTPMKRSEINRHLIETLRFFDIMKVRLPQWGYWAPGDWKGKAATVASVVENGLGWDITDFGSGDFARVGLINFNPRNIARHLLKESVLSRDY